MAGFGDILGHKQEIAHLTRAIETGKVSHAYIFAGEKGTGKNRLASAFAQTLQCESAGERPCGRCHSCLQAESGNHPDIIYLAHEKPSSIGVEDIRDQLAGDIQIRPYNGNYKIYIIPDAERMTVQAQNAILKTIEEPPEYAVIILLTMQISELIDYVKEVQEYKVTIQDYLDILALWYRDMVYYKATRDIDGIVFQDELKTIRDTVKVCSYEGVEEVMKAIENAKMRLSANVNFDLTMELLFLVMKENIHG